VLDLDDEELAVAQPRVARHRRPPAGAERASGRFALERQGIGLALLGAHAREPLALLGVGEAGAVLDHAASKAELRLDDGREVDHRLLVVVVVDAVERGHHARGRLKPVDVAALAARPEWHALEARNRVEAIPVPTMLGPLKAGRPPASGSSRSTRRPSARRS
jgi:hypothetical protein